MRILDDKHHASEWIRCAYIYAKALRMTGKHQESIDLLSKVLNSGDLRTKDFISEIHLSLAMCYDHLELKDNAVKHAKLVFEYCEKESGSYFQAYALLAEHEYSGAQLEMARRSIHKRAREKGCTTAANNIALELAKTSDKKDSIRLLDDVIKTARDSYNQTRAIANKADLLRRTGGLDKLTHDELFRLSSAYEYSCAQRLGGLLDSCHDALWEFCKIRNFWAGMFRLFRFSSFVWCLSDRPLRDKQYIPELVNVKKDEAKLITIEVDLEIEYLEKRLASEGSV